MSTPDSSSAPVAPLLPAPPAPPRLSGSIDALGAGLDAQLSQLSHASSLLHAHFERTLPPHLHPAALIDRLHAMVAAVPALAARQRQVQEARQPLLEEVERLMDANRALLSDMQARMDAHDNGEAGANVVAASSLTTPSKSPLLRPQTAPLTPLTLPSAPAPATAAAGGAASKRRKSVRPSTSSSSLSSSSHPPSPSPSPQAILAEVQEEGPVSQREFDAVSSTVKSRIKLADVNTLLGVIQTHFARVISHMPPGRALPGGGRAAPDPASLPPLTLTTLAELGGAGKIGGATSQCIIGTLRACKRILVDRRGILLVKLPPKQMMTQGQ